MSTSGPASPTPPRQPGLPEIDVREHGGKGQVLERRLFVQLVVADATRGSGDALVTELGARLAADAVPSVVYADLAQPSGAAVLTWSEDPSHLVTRLRRAFGAIEPGSFSYRPSFSMIGRTYASGYEPDLEHWLLRRPVENVLNPAHAWHVWYPLRRAGAFNRLDPHEQSSILREHAQIGFAYGQAGLASDVRLACHGLDPQDNDFVIGLVGRELHSLSHLVQTMRRTVQTSQWMEKMGPFFVGEVKQRIA